MDNVGTLHKRYAKAMFIHAKKYSDIDRIMRDIETLDEILHTSKDAFDILRHPETGKDERIDSMREIVKKAGLDNTLVDFLKVLVRKNRLDLIHGICLRFRNYYDEERKRTKVFVKSAVELSKEQIDKLLKTLCDRLKEEVSLDIKIDPSILGGLFVRIHDRIYDYTVLGMIKNMNRGLTG